MPGVPELLVILLIVLLIFGAGKLPAIGDALGRSIKNFKRSASGADEGQRHGDLEPLLLAVAELAGLGSQQLVQAGIAGDGPQVSGAQGCRQPQR